MTAVKPTPATVELVIDREFGKCAVCYNTIDTDPQTRGVRWSIHHRCPRASGGTKRAWVNEPANLLLVCGSGTTGCHGWIESNRTTATPQGLLISSIGRAVAEEVENA
jgi:hypothetical protein